MKKLLFAHFLKDILEQQMPVITEDAIFPVPIKPKFITQSFI